MRWREWRILNDVLIAFLRQHNLALRGNSFSRRFSLRYNIKTLLSMKEIDTEKIVSEFENFCIQNDIAARDLKPKLANKYAKKIINSYLQLKELGETNALTKLLESENENVRLWAATHTLPTNEAKAKRVLQELAVKPGFNAFSAEMTLSEWGKGALKLAYDTYKVKW
jgi:hypothetical protein